jgi:serine protease Do
MENNTKSSVSKTRNRLMAAVASLAIAGAIGFGAVATGTVPVRAEAVRVESPQQVPSFADVVQKVSPAVVSVRVSAKVAPAADDGQGGFFSFPGFPDLPKDHPLNRFFRNQPQEPGQHFGNRNRPERARPSAQGSGFFISEDGYVVTNNHVVDGGSEFTVVLDDGTELAAKLVGTDPRTDLAVLKVDDSRKFTYVDFADDATVRVGDWVVAVGNPFGLGGTVTAGIVSARGRDIGAGPYDDFIQIDAAVNRGNSGGPAFNLNGQVVGINTAIFSPSGGNVGIAFAIPASTAKDVVNRLISDGSVERGWLGVQIQPVTKDIAESLGLAKTEGALVADPQADGPAKAAGIAAGDVITAVDGKTVESPRELARQIANMSPGTKTDITVWRGGESKTISVKLGELPGATKEAKADTSPPASADVLDTFGLTVTPAEDGNGLVVTDVDPNGDAAERGIQAGDVILAVNSSAVKSAADMQKAVKAASDAGRKAVLLQVERDDASHFIALPVAEG